MICCVLGICGFSQFNSARVLNHIIRPLTLSHINRCTLCIVHPFQTVPIGSCSTDSGAIPASWITRAEPPSYLSLVARNWLVCFRWFTDMCSCTTINSDSLIAALSSMSNAALQCSYPQIHTQELLIVSLQRISQNWSHSANSITGSYNAASLCFPMILQALLQLSCTIGECSTMCWAYLLGLDWFSFTEHAHLMLIQSVQQFLVY